MVSLGTKVSVAGATAAEGRSLERRGRLNALFGDAWKCFLLSPSMFSFLLGRRNNGLLQSHSAAAAAPLWPWMVLRVMPSQWPGLTALVFLVKGNMVISVQHHSKMIPVNRKSMFSLAVSTRLARLNLASIVSSLSKPISLKAVVPFARTSCQSCATLGIPRVLAARVETSGKTTTGDVSSYLPVVSGRAPRHRSLSLNRSLQPQPQPQPQPVQTPMPSPMPIATANCDNLNDEAETCEMQFGGNSVCVPCMAFIYSSIDSIDCTATADEFCQEIASETNFCSCNAPCYDAVALAVSCGTDCEGMNCSAKPSTEECEEALATVNECFAQCVF